MSSVLTYVIFFIFSCMMTGILRILALKKKVLDIPNQRSSHETPTPRGGGLAFVLCFLIALLIGFWKHSYPWDFFAPIFISLFLVALIGACDDYLGLSAKYRLVGHFVAAGLVLFALGGASTLFALNQSWSLLLVDLIILLYLVWFINLYNFMDGIDGIAGVQALTVSLGGALLFILDGHERWVSSLLIFSSSLIGFLLWNFPRARIFMGDGGSGFLGLLMGTFSLIALQINASLFYGWLILNAVFCADATITLLRRAWFRENIFSAHCSHAYQNVARYFQNHWIITLVVALINCCWLLPLAILAQQSLLWGPLAVFLAYLPLIVLVFKLNKVTTWN